MGVYTGWQRDLLAVVKLPDTAANRRFLSDWHSHASSDCKLNPVDLTHVIKDAGSGGARHSQDCKAVTLPSGSAHFQAYDDRVWTRTAFAAQLTSGDYPHLRHALRTGNPYSPQRFNLTAAQAIAADLGAWGSGAFGNAYIKTMAAGGPIPQVKAARLHKGYADLQRSVNHRFPQALRRSQHSVNAGLRSIARARKVRL